MSYQAQRYGMEERRAWPRSRVSRGAEIILGRGSPIIVCMLHDLTNFGVCMSLTGAELLPETFELTFDHGRSSRPCRVRWRLDDKVGVAFEKAHSLSG